MAGKPDKERMGQDMKYVIDSEIYFVKKLLL